MVCQGYLLTLRAGDMLECAQIPTASRDQQVMVMGW